MTLRLLKYTWITKNEQKCFRYSNVEVFDEDGRVASRRSEEAERGNGQCVTIFNVLSTFQLKNLG